jgi:hypothetical protein
MAGHACAATFAFTMIEVDVNSFEQRRPGDSVTGIIYLDLEVGAFPELGWFDFPVKILGWWVSRHLELGLPERRTVKWMFMDGLFSVTLTKIVGGRSNQVMDYRGLSDCLLAAADRSIAYCEAHELLSPDLEGLRSAAQQLKANLAVQRTEPSRNAPIEIQASWTSGSRR